MSKVAIVTGAGTGIGKASALALLKAGWQVALAGRRAELLEKAIAESGASKNALAVATDVGKPDAVKALFRKTVDKFGRLDLLFNNAGMGTPGNINLEDLTVEQWQAVVAVNLTGPFLCTQEAFRIMKAQNPRGGRIINNGSISAHAPRPNSSPYTSTKHAITGLTRASMLDGRKYDIAVGQVDIGNAATEMTDRMVQGQGVAQPNGSMMIEPRMDVQHVADAIVHMASLPLESNVLFMTNKSPEAGRDRQTVSGRSRSRPRVPAQRTTSASFTSVTPSTPAAALTAWSRSALLRTTPVSMTRPWSVSTSTSRDFNSGARSSAALTLAVITLSST
jgi:NAD(P)-dependent dehydrogenase (short-subunit alcohol dehydrogenase family)